MLQASLNYYSQWLARSVGTYNDQVWKDLRSKHGSPVFRHYHSMGYTIPAMIKLIQENVKDVVFNPSFFESRISKYLDTTFIVVKPIAQFPNEEVELRYNVGTRGNGVDQPVWPQDLSVEVVQ